MAIALLGAGGALGRAVAAALARDGVDVEARDARRDAPRLVTQADAVVAACPPGPDLDRVVAAVAEGGGAYVEAVPDPHRFVRLAEQYDQAARRAGAVIVPAAGWAFALGDLLVARGAEGMPDVREVHVTYYVPGVRSVLARPTPGWRRDVLDLLAAPVPVRVGGRPASERVAETRRLAWFPRPVGPHHAVAVPGAEPVTVPRHVAGVETARTYLALRSWLAEAVQAAGTLAGTARGGAWLHRRARRPTRTAAARQRAGERWAVVAELADARGGVTRAWAYGHDRTATAGAILAAVAARLPSAGAAPGVRSVAEVLDAATILDGLAAATDLRWSVARPDG